MDEPRPDTTPTTTVTTGLDGIRATVTDDNYSDAERVRRQAAQEFLTKAKQRFSMIVNAESKMRAEQLEDLRFSSGAPYQWPANVQADRDLDGRPCLTINGIDPPIKQVANQQRQSRPAIQVNPVDDAADPETAEIFQGLIRRIEIQSDADVIYASACDRQLRAGRSYWRVVTEYQPGTFEQEIKIKRIRNSFTVYFDPTAQELDFSDARFVFIVTDLPKDEYLERYATSEVASLSAFASIGDSSPDWAPEGRVRVAEYYYLETTPEEIAEIRLPDGQMLTRPMSEVQPLPLPPDLASVPPEQLASPDQWPKGWMPPGAPQLLPVQVVRTRKASREVVKWATINALEVLDGNASRTAGRQIIGTNIPVVCIIGDEYDLDGEIDYRGMVRGARDAQRMSNYHKSAMTEAVALAPKAPFMVAEGQLEGHETEWQQANRRNLPYLTYKPTTLAGQLAPQPQRQSPSTDIQAMTYLSQQAENDLRRMTGFYDVHEQERKGEQSGRAILARQRQGEMGNSQYLENVSYGIRRTGRILLGMIPEVYDKLQVRRILGVDDQEKEVAVHAGRVPMRPDGSRVSDQELLQALPARFKNIDRIYDLSVGRYDVNISVGPSYQSRRQEAVEAMVQLSQSNAQLLPIIGDLLIGQMDWPGAPQIAERLKKLLPPALQEHPEGPLGQSGPTPQQVQQQMQAFQQHIQQLTAQLQHAQQVVQSKQMELGAQERMKQLELASLERRTAMDVQAQLVQTQSKIDAQRADAAINAQLEDIQHRISLLHEQRMAHENRAAEFQMEAIKAEQDALRATEPVA